jgi:hypothetical protein
VDWDNWTVDRQLLEIGAAIPVQLGIQVAEDSALKQRIFGLS